MNSILFVDDEQRILDGLRDLLRKYRRKWDMTFAPGPEHALAELAKRSFDVVVSDMRMPGMDGAQLLGRVKESSPHTVRIVLSGHTEVEAVLRAIPIAHQFLSKPCDARTMESVVDRTVGLSNLIQEERIRKVLGSVEKLPSLPHVYRELVALLQRPEASAADVAKVLERDVAMCAKLLQIVNSAFFGLPRRVSKIENAVVYLGLNTVRSLVLVAEAFSAGAATGLPVEHMQSAAVVASRIARRLLPDKIQADDAAMAAMLCDVGILVLASQFKTDHAALWRDRGDEPLHVAEGRAFGVSHAEAGAYLLGIWGLPFPIVEALAYHHTPSRVPHPCFDVVAATHVATQLAHEVLPGGQPHGNWDHEYLQAVGALDMLDEWRRMAREIAGV